MPYIKQEERNRFQPALDPLLEEVLNGSSLTPGDLNYLVTKLCHAYMQRKGLSYTHLSDVMATLTNAAHEFYRRKVVPYEEQKREENGDV